MSLLGWNDDCLPDEVTISGTTYSLCLQGEEIDMMGALTSYLGVNESSVLRIALHGLYSETMAEMENSSI